MPTVARVLTLFVFTLLVAAPAARADVTRVEVKTRAPIGSSGYEKIVGVAYFAVDPHTAGNSVIADLEKAPGNADGKVEFSADV